jgi:hypothetical protein
MTMATAFTFVLATSGCGTTVASRLAGNAVITAQQVIQDPDNPTVAPASVDVIRDPRIPAGGLASREADFRLVNTQPCYPNDSLCNEQ